jgi:hypothetical protein
MAAEFSESGVSFRYPESWTIEREESESGWVVTVNSPGTAFVTVCLRQDRPGVKELSTAVLDTLRQDYPELEADEKTERLAGRKSFGHDIRFFSLDLTNSCWTRSFSSPSGTVLVMCQTSDLELETTGPILKAIRDSLRVSDATL